MQFNHKGTEGKWVGLTEMAIHFPVTKNFNPSFSVLCGLSG
jgi:hypothetical protein